MSDEVEALAGVGGLPLADDVLAAVLEDQGEPGVRALGLMRDAHRALTGAQFARPAEVAAAYARSAADALLGLPGAPVAVGLKSAARGLLSAVDAFRLAERIGPPVRRPALARKDGSRPSREGREPGGALPRRGERLRLWPGAVEGRAPHRAVSLHRWSAVPLSSHWRIWAPLLVLMFCTPSSRWLLLLMIL